MAHGINIKELLYDNFIIDLSYYKFPLTVHQSMEQAK